MKKKLSQIECEQAADMLNQCALALKFYIATQEVKYLEKLRISSNQLYLLVNEKEVKHGSG